MAGHVRKRADRWRALFPDPLRGGTHQIERSFPRKIEAEDWLDNMRHAAKTGTYIDPTHAQRTFGQLVDEWRGIWTDLEPKTKAGYESILNRHLLPRFQSARLSAITPDVVQRIVKISRRITPPTR